MLPWVYRKRQTCTHPITSFVGFFRLFLGTHPDIASIYTERHFFDEHYQKGFEWYRKLMPKSQLAQQTMETSAGYFARAKSHHTAERIYCMNPDIKLIMICRNPVTRLISDYVHDRAMRRPPEIRKKLEDLVINKSNGAINANYVKVKFSLYDEHMKTWLQFFPRKNIQVIDGESFQKNPLPTLKKCEKFLRLKEYFSLKQFYYNDKRGFYCLKKKTTCKYSRGRPLMVQNRSDPAQKKIIQGASNKVRRGVPEKNCSQEPAPHPQMINGQPTKLQFSH